MATVLKVFTTALRRFTPGEPISPREDLRPRTFEALVASGHVEPLPAKASPRRPKTRRKS